MDKMYIQVERERGTIILDKVRKGQITIPRFQRDYVWTSKQVVEFFDSILKGWPIGSLLFWAPETDVFSVIDEIGGIHIDISNTRELFYVLDGRQRITTLLSVLSQDGAFSKDYYVDLDEMRVVSSPKNKKHTTVNYILLSEAYDSFTLVDYLERMRKEISNIQKQLFYANRAKELNKILTNYELSYIEVHGGGIGDAVQIFYRLNDKSTPVSPDYMIQALSYSPKQDFLFADAITEIKNELEEYNMAELSRDLILKCVYNYSEKYFIDAKAEDLYKRNDLKSIMQNVRQDILLAANYLFTNCRLIDVRLLPYSYQFVMCAMFFKYNPQATDKQLIELKKWFFYTTYTSYFTNTSLGVIRGDLNRFEAFCKGDIATPIDYAYDFEKAEMPQSATLGAVRNCALAMALLSYKTITKNSCFEVYSPSKISKHSLDYTIICTSKAEKQELCKLFSGKSHWKKDFEERFFISEDMMLYYNAGHYSEFMSLYTNKVHQLEDAFVTQVIQSIK